MQIEQDIKALKTIFEAKESCTIAPDTSVWGDSCVVCNKWIGPLSKMYRVKCQGQTRHQSFANKPVCQQCAPMMLNMLGN